MKTRLVAILVSMSIVLSGCMIGNGHICGPQTPMAYCDKKAYNALVHPPSSMEKWQGDADHPERRKQDWIACGGMAKGGVADVSGSTDKETVELSGKKFDDVQRCMMAKGYRYIGSCEGSIPSGYPACQARDSALPAK